MPTRRQNLWPVLATGTGVCRGQSRLRLGGDCGRDLRRLADTPSGRTERPDRRARLLKTCQDRMGQMEDELHRLPLPIQSSPA